MGIRSIHLVIKATNINIVPINVEGSVTIGSLTIVIGGKTPRQPIRINTNPV